MTSVGADAFKSCKYAKKITFNGTLTSLSTGNLFSGCNALEEIAGFNIPANTTSIGGSAFRYCYALKNAGDFIVDGILYLPEGIDTINTFAFSECKAIEAIIFPSTLTYIGQQGFSYMDNVKIVSMDRITGALTLHNCGHFRGLKNLVAVSLPEGIVEVSNRAFADCANLTAVYMPNSVKYLCSNGGGQGSFCNASKMYFVQESFTVEECIVDGKVDTSKLSLPQKPEVYYMPTSLLTFTGHTYTNDSSCNATIFKNCYAINDVLVFPESFTKMVTMRPFENMASAESPKTIVFLGDIQEFAISHQSRYITFIFANENDEGFEDLGIKRVTGNSNEAGSKAFFCSTGTKYDLAVSGRVGSDTDPTTEKSIANINTTVNAIKATASQESLHIANPQKTEVNDATCTTIGGKIYYCFCGEKIGEEKTADALGHNKSEIVVINYNGANRFFETGDITYHCDRCNLEHTVEDEAEIIFVARGYSYTEMGEARKAIMQAFGINRVALAIYNENTDKEIVDYGVLAVTEKGLNGATDIFDTDGTVNTRKANAASHFGRNFDLIEMKISGLEGEKDGIKFANEKIYCCAYIQIKNGDIIDSYYASKGNDGKLIDESLFGGVSFNELVG